MGMTSLAVDGWAKRGVTVEVDASAAIGRMQRRGLGKVRHLDVQELWTQDAIRKGKLKVRKIKGSLNTGDMMTKPLNRAETEKNLEVMGYRCRKCL